MFKYPTRIEKEKNGSYTLTFPDVPEAVTFGDTKDEAMSHAVDALETALSFYVDANKALPTPSKATSDLVSVSLLGSLKLAVYKGMKEKSVRKTDLARRMGVALMQVDRILDLTHSSKIEQIESALAALDKKVFLAEAPLHPAPRKRVMSSKILARNSTTGSFAKVGLTEKKAAKKKA